MEGSYGTYRIRPRKSCLQNCPCARDCGAGHEPRGAGPETTLEAGPRKLPSERPRGGNYPQARKLGPGNYPRSGPEGETTLPEETTLGAAPGPFCHDSRPRPVESYDSSEPRKNPRDNSGSMPRR